MLDSSHVRWNIFDLPVTIVRIDFTIYIFWQYSKNTTVFTVWIFSPHAITGTAITSMRHKLTTQFNFSGNFLPDVFCDQFCGAVAVSNKYGFFRL